MNRMEVGIGFLSICIYFFRNCSCIYHFDLASSGHKQSLGGDNLPAGRRELIEEETVPREQFLLAQTLL